MAPSKAHEPTLRTVFADLATEAGVPCDSVVRASGMSANALDRAPLGRGRFPVSALIGAADALHMKASDVLDRVEAHLP